MALNTEHPDYKKLAPQWKRCRDVASGQDAVHSAGVLYLPKLKDQTDDDYNAYRKRATFFNASWRTIAGLRGMLFRKPAEIDVPPSVSPLLQTVTEDGQPFETFATEVVEECLTTGRAGVIVDYPVITDPELTQADAALLNLRPSMALYKAEAIINWKETAVNNLRVLTKVILREVVSIDGEDEFEQVEETRYRILDLVNGVYRVRLYKATSAADDEFEQIGEDLFPTLGNGPMRSIPFFFIGTDDTEVCPDEPPLIDLVDLNLAHYRTNADYEHGCHFTGLPTGYICGHTMEAGELIYLGSQAMLVFPNPDTKVGFLEFSGAGLSMLESNLARKEQQMAILGARMLESQKRAVEAADTAAINRAGENSLLASIAQSISRGLSGALQMFSNWSGGGSVVNFELNRDFFPVPMDPARLTALVTSWQYGAISKETLFDNLKQGEIVSDNSTFEDEEVKIANAAPTFATNQPALANP